MRRCYNCQKEIAVQTPAGPEDTCPFCSAALHCCFNCRDYSPTAKQQCLGSRLELIANKKAANTCEGFQIREFQALRKNSQPGTAKKKWDDLFSV